MEFDDANIESPGGFNTDGGKSWDNTTKVLPADLPKSLDDRRHVPVELVPETEMYDGWQGVFFTFYQEPAITLDIWLIYRARAITIPDITYTDQTLVFRRPQLT